VTTHQIPAADSERKSGVCAIPAEGPTVAGHLVHPAAAVFPLLSGNQLSELAEDIRTHGLRQPIVLDAQGRVIDGRNRLAVCERAGVDPSFTKFPGTEEEICAFIISMNVHRRMLTKKQQAELIVAVLNTRADLAKSARSVPQGETGFNLANSAELKNQSKRSDGRGHRPKDPLKAAAVAEGAKHGISKRVVEDALAKAKPAQTTKKSKGRIQTTGKLSGPNPVMARDTRRIEVQEHPGERVLAAVRAFISTMEGIDETVITTMPGIEGHRLKTVAAQAVDHLWWIIRTIDKGTRAAS
jgi:ParB/Sulfiredoxin domain